MSAGAGAITTMDQSNLSTLSLSSLFERLAVTGSSILDAVSYRNSRSAPVPAGDISWERKDGTLKAVIIPTLVTLVAVR